MNLDRIPSELKRRPQWVLWRIEEREGKPTKIPYNPKNPSAKAEADNPDTWGEYGQAAQYWQAHKGNGIAGIGYEFSFYDPYCGIDLDKCRDPGTGEIEAWAADIIKRLNSYTEISPSGRGVHIILKGKLPQGPRRKGRVEMYDVGRYFTMTGAHLEGTPTNIEDRQFELTAFHREVFGQPKEEAKRGPSSTLNMSDQELINRACGADDGGKFERL